MENTGETLMETPETSAGRGRGRSPESRGTQFQPGHTGPKSGSVPDEMRVESDQLADMRQVFANRASLDSTHSQRMCRKWMKTDLKGFMSAMDRLEEAGVSRIGSAASEDSSSDVVEPDVGSKRALAMIEELLNTASQKAEERDDD